MTDSTRLAALEAVADAARSLVDSTGTTTMALFWAFEALDALPAPTPVETVTLGLWEHVAKQARIMAVLLAHASSAPLTDEDMQWARAQVAALEPTR